MGSPRVAGGRFQRALSRRCHPSAATPHEPRSTSTSSTTASSGSRPGPQPGRRARTRVGTVNPKPVRSRSAPAGRPGRRPPRPTPQPGPTNAPADRPRCVRRPPCIVLSHAASMPRPDGTVHYPPHHHHHQHQVGEHTEGCQAPEHELTTLTTPRQHRCGSTPHGFVKRAVRRVIGRAVGRAVPRPIGRDATRQGLPLWITRGAVPLHASGGAQQVARLVQLSDERGGPLEGVGHRLMRRVRYRWRARRAPLSPGDRCSGCRRAAAHGWPWG